MEDWTVHRNEFILLFGADGVLCIIVLVMVSQFFTKNLTSHIMEPLDALAEGVKRIQENDLTQEIAYTGELEFENVCAAMEWVCQKKMRMDLLCIWNCPFRRRGVNEHGGQEKNPDCGR